jgi:hypothetical protein
MKLLIALLLTAVATAAPAAAQVVAPTGAQLKGQLRIPEFATLASKASESVAVTMDHQVLAMGCRFLNADDPEQADAKKLCDGLSGIYVRSYTFDKDFAYPQADVEGVRRQLSGPGWSRIVEARSNKENTNVDVFVMIDNGKAKGLGIIASEPREFTIVNIVGNIDLEQLHSLEGKFSIPNLGIETSKKPEPPKPEPPKMAPKKK